METILSGANPTSSDSYAHSSNDSNAFGDDDGGEMPLCGQIGYHIEIEKDNARKIMRRREKGCPSRQTHLVSKENSS